MFVFARADLEVNKRKTSFNKFGNIKPSLLSLAPYQQVIIASSYLLIVSDYFPRCSLRRMWMLC